MEPNLYQGDYIIVSKFSYGYSRHSVPFSPRIFNGRVKLGDTVTCVFENTGQGVTRTQGFWATHPQLAQIAVNAPRRESQVGLFPGRHHNVKGHISRNRISG